MPGETLAGIMVIGGMAMKMNAERSKRGAAAMAAQTMGRSRRFEDRKAEEKRARFGGKERRAMMRGAW
jgi:hypothetical protein